MRKPAWAIGGLAVVAMLVVGFIQLSDSPSAATTSTAPLSRAQAARPIAGVPAQLAALRGQVNERRAGGRRALDAQLLALRGHPVVVNLWASWCGPCAAELPFLQRQAVKRAKTVAFLGVNVNDAAVDAARLAARDPMPYPSFEDRDGKIAAGYGAIGLPVTVFYDAAGRRQFVHQGVFASEQLLSDAIDRYAPAR